MRAPGAVVNRSQDSAVGLLAFRGRPVLGERKASRSPLLAAYLSDTPFFKILLVPVSYALPDEQRFAGHWIVAPPGRGKRTALNGMVLSDLERDACVIVMVSIGVQI